jgi:CRP/FNR family cyclic AMP-dependent transcriptional regulator
LKREGHFYYKCFVASDGVEIAGFLKACGLFRGFSEPNLLILSKVFVEKKIPAGTPIFVQNMVADALLVIKLGVVELSLGSGQNRCSLTAGDSFGELALLFGGQRAVTATAVTDCEILELTRRQFAALQRQKPQLCAKTILGIVRVFSERLASSRSHLIDLLVQGAR